MMLTHSDWVLAWSVQKTNVNEKGMVSGRHRQVRMKTSCWVYAQKVKEIAGLHLLLG